MKDRVKTPRGTFPVRFDSLEEAEAAGYRLWFREEDLNIVNNGMNAAAVRPSAVSIVTEIHPSAARKKLLFVRLADGWCISLDRKDVRALDIRVGDTLRYFRLGKAAPCVVPERRPPDAVPFTW